MARLPWFPFYPADWFRDTRCLSCAAKGVWIDLLGILWDSKTRGRKTLDMPGWAAELGKPLRVVDKLFKELATRDICEMVTARNKSVTVMSRRQVREEKVRQSTRSRVSNFRKRHSNAGSNGQVTRESQNQSQNQKKTKILATPPKGDKTGDKSAREPIHSIVQEMIGKIVKDMPS